MLCPKFRVIRVREAVCVVRGYSSSYFSSALNSVGSLRKLWGSTESIAATPACGSSVVFFPYFTKPTVKQAGNNNEHIEIVYGRIRISIPV